MDTGSNKKKAFSMPLGSQTSQLTSSGKGKSHSVQPVGQQTKASSTAVQQPHQPTPLHQQMVYPIPSGQVPPAGHEAFYPALPAQQMSPATSSWKGTSQSTPSSKRMSQPTPYGKATSHLTPQGQQSPTPKASFQHAPQPSLLGPQAPPPMPPGQVLYYMPPTDQLMPLGAPSAQQVAYPMTPGQQVPYLSQQIQFQTPSGLQVTYSTLPGQQLPHQMPPGSPILPHLVPPSDNPPEQKTSLKTEVEEVGTNCYCITMTVLAVVLTINAITWCIVHTIWAANSGGDIHLASVFIAIAFAFSMFTHCCGIVFSSTGPDKICIYVSKSLIVDFVGMIVAVILAAIYGFIATAIDSSVVIVMIFVQAWLSYLWRVNSLQQHVTLPN